MCCHSDNYTDSYVLSNTNSYSTDSYSELHNLNMEQDFKTWLDNQLRELSMTPTAFAREAGTVNQPTVQRILSGETKSPGLTVITKIEKAIQDLRASRAMPYVAYTGQHGTTDATPKTISALSEPMFNLGCTKCGKMGLKSFIELELNDEIACECGASIRVSDQYSLPTLEAILKNLGGSGFVLRKRYKV